MNIPFRSYDLRNITKKWPAFVILTIFSLSVLAGGIVFYFSQKKSIVKDKQNELNAIANLKIEDLTKWRSEHLRDARILSTNSGLKRMFLEFMKGEISENSIRDVFLPMIDEYDYRSIFIADSTGQIKFSTSGIDTSVNDFTVDYSTALPEFNFIDNGAEIFLDIVSIITDNAGKSAGYLVLRIDPEIVLFPLIQTWPAPSKTSETLLIRLEGDSIVYLNELRHVQNSALKLRLPANDKDLPAARVASGYEGFFEGIDYRGVPVVSYLRKVPDSPWYMVAKVDKEEIFSPLVEQSILIALIVILSIITFSVIIGFYFRNQRIRYLNEITATKDKLYSIISHDLKNPFVSILGFCELLHTRILSNDFSRVREFTGIIYNSSANAVELLNNLTSWTKLQTGRVVYNPGLTNIARLIKEVVDSCKAAALMKSISLKFSVADELEMNVDRTLLATILRNLIINAIKFSHQNSEVFISAMKNSSFFEIMVEDSGIGLDKQTINKILNMKNYDSFPGTSNEKGTGLGLLICMEFIQMHNGVLNIESDKGKGSRFSIKLPAG